VTRYPIEVKIVDDGDKVEGYIGPIKRRIKGEVIQRNGLTINFYNDGNVDEDLKQCHER
jgi:PII-like signaling protein